MSVPSVALTLWPEWAFALCYLGKRCENRTWRLPAAYLGVPVLIHAGAYIGGSKSRRAMIDGIEGVCRHAEAAGWTMDAIYTWPAADGHGASVTAQRPGAVLDAVPVARRAFVCVATFDRVEQVEPRTAIDPDDPFGVGPFIWRASSVRVLAHPVQRHRGAQGFWPIDKQDFVSLTTAVAAAG